MNVTAALAPWQHGIPMDHLKAVTAQFAEYETGLTFGQFAGVSERQVAEWLRAQELHASGRTIVVYRRAKVATPVGDFTGAEACRIPQGALVVKRLCTPEGAEGFAVLLEALRVLPRPFWIETWAEKAGERQLLRELGAQWRATKIAASSELRQVSYVPPVPEACVLPPYNTIDELALGQLPAGAAGPRWEYTDALVAAVARLPLDVFQQHYSSYNKGRSWTAVALRGFGGEVGFIEKPAEMARSWKEANREKLAWGCLDTPLRALLPEVEPILRSLGDDTELERVRLMQLAPGGGELARHADITNRDAGTRLGNIVRLHFPLLTNPEVEFCSWGLQGELIRRHMALGGWWYLDQRKPHTARNGGPTARVHLVCDVYVNVQLQEWLAGAA